MSSEMIFYLVIWIPLIGYTIHGISKIIDNMKSIKKLKKNTKNMESIYNKLTGKQ